MPEEKKAAVGSSNGDSKLFGALCYIIGILVPLFVLFTEKKNDKFLAFHAWQSLLLSVVFVVVWIGLAAVTFIAGMLTVFAGGIGGFIGCLGLPVLLIWFLAVVLGAYKAYQGEKYVMPVIGDFAMKQASK